MRVQDRMQVTLIRVVAVEGRLVFVAVLVVLVLLKGLRALGACVCCIRCIRCVCAQQAVPVVALPSGKTETGEYRYLYRIPRAAVRGRVRGQIWGAGLCW